MITQTTDRKTRIVSKELQARIDLLREALTQNGFLASQEVDTLNISHPNGYEKRAFFNQRKMRQVLSENGLKSLAEKEPLSFSKITHEYLKGGYLALKQDRPHFVERYYQSIYQEMLDHVPTKPTRKQELEATVQSVPDKEVSTPEL